MTQQITTFTQGSHHKAGPADAQINASSFPGQAPLPATVRHEAEVQASRQQTSETQRVESQSLLTRSGAMHL